MNYYKKYYINEQIDHSRTHLKYDGDDERHYV